MYDLHCHAGFSADPAVLGGLIEASDLQVLSATVTPDEFIHMRTELAGAPSVHVAAGLHPWWVPSDDAAAEAIAEQLLGHLDQTRFIGEVGLDFSPAHAHSKQEQLSSLSRILGACADLGGKVVTIHSVRATSDLLDLLEKTRCTESCACIMHWFSGTSDELQRAIGLGCFFSVGERMLATKRGRAHVRSIPAGRLLLETDLPKQCEPDEREAQIPDQSDSGNPPRGLEDRVHREFVELTASLNAALEGALAAGGPHTASSIEAASRKLLDGKD